MDVCELMVEKVVGKIMLVTEGVVEVRVMVLMMREVEKVDKTVVMARTYLKLMVKIAEVMDRRTRRDMPTRREHSQKMDGNYMQVVEVVMVEVVMVEVEVVEVVTVIVMDVMGREVEEVVKGTVATEQSYSDGHNI